MIDFISAQEASEKWNITRRRVQYLCAGGKVKGAEKFVDVWMIPADAEKPPDGRRFNRRRPKRKQTEAKQDGQ